MNDLVKHTDVKTIAFYSTGADNQRRLYKYIRINECDFCPTGYELKYIKIADSSAVNPINNLVKIANIDKSYNNLPNKFIGNFIEFQTPINDNRIYSNYYWDYENYHTYMGYTLVSITQDDVLGKKYQDEDDICVGYLEGPHKFYHWNGVKYQEVNGYIANETEASPTTFNDKYNNNDLILYKNKMYSYNANKSNYIEVANENYGIHETFFDRMYKDSNFIETTVSDLGEIIITSITLAWNNHYYNSNRSNRYYRFRSVIIDTDNNKYNNVPTEIAGNNGEYIIYDNTVYKWKPYTLNGSAGYYDRIENCKIVYNNNTEVGVTNGYIKVDYDKTKGYMVYKSFNVEKFMENEYSSVTENDSDYLCVVSAIYSYDTDEPYNDNEIYIPKGEDPSKETVNIKTHMGDKYPTENSYEFPKTVVTGYDNKLDSPESLGDNLTKNIYICLYQKKCIQKTQDSLSLL